MKKLSILFTMALFILGSAGLLNAQELVLNGDLEAWDDPSNPTSWNKAENIGQATDPVHGGTYSAMHTSSDDGTQDFQQNVSGIVGGANYTISYWYFDNSTEAKTRIWAYWLDGTSTLDDNQAELRPSAYSENDPDWQQFSVSLTAPANADGFRFEVRVYHEDNVTGGSVYYDDFSVMGAGIAPEPTNYPTGLSAAASGISVNLEWTDAIGDQLPNGYLILAADYAKITPPVDGTPVENDLDFADGTGALNVGYGEEMCSFNNLNGNTQYFFVVYPYTNGAADIDYKNDGIAPQVNATTADINVVINQNFDAGFGDWQTISVIGEQVWFIDPDFGVGGTPCAKMNGYSGGSVANEDWLISPAMDLEEFAAVSLTYMTAMNYTGPELEVLVSTDYDGGGDPSTATWEDLGGTLSGGGFAWTESGTVDLSTHLGSAVYLAYKYTSTDSESSTWEVDNIVVTAGGIMPEPSEYPADFIAKGLGSSIGIEWADATGTDLPSGYLVIGSSDESFTPPVDGTPVEDDDELSDGYAVLNIAYGVESCSFGNLGTNETYYFTIFPYANAGTNIDYKTDGTAPTANATTADVSVIEGQNFDDGWGDWTQYSVTGQQEWELDDIHGIDGSPCAKCSGYDGQTYENEDWLISPAMDFDSYNGEVLSFYTAKNYTGPDLMVLISDDYSGGDPTQATWTELTYTMSSGGWEWTASGDIDISDWNGEEVYVGFKFESTDAESATWELDDVMITGVEVIGIDEENEFSASVKLFPNPASGYVNISSDTRDEIRFALYSITGTLVAEETSFMGSAKLDLGSVTPGIYLVRFTDEDGNSRIEKLVIEK